jgi:ABC-type hemin transport system ATPase subunit
VSKSYLNTEKDFRYVVLRESTTDRDCAWTRFAARLLLLDEPTAGMNPSETAEVLEQLLELLHRCCVSLH